MGKRTYPWDDIKVDYIVNKLSYRDIQRKYGCGLTTIYRHASAEGWEQQRKQNDNDIVTSIINRDKENRIEKLLPLIDTADILSAKAKELAESADSIRDIVDLAKALKDIAPILKSLNGIQDTEERDTTVVVKFESEDMNDYVG